MSYYEPEKQFSEAPESLAKGTIQELSENQCRWALWSVLTLLFGNIESNAPEIVMRAQPLHRDTAFALALLGQLGFGRSLPGEANELLDRAKRI